MGQNQLDPDQGKFQNETSVNAHCEIFFAETLQEIADKSRLRLKCKTLAHAGKLITLVFPRVLCYDTKRNCAQSSAKL